MKKKILLLNPPGKKLYIRDYYCSKVSKSNYSFHPIDLLMLSGRLADDHEIFVIDAISEDIDANNCRRRIETEIQPDVIISLIGSVSIEEDIPFISSLAKSGREILVTGDSSLENPSQWLKNNEFVDAVILDFSSDEICLYLNGNIAGLKTIVFRYDNTISDSKFHLDRPVNDKFSLPIPKHEMFHSPNYRFPFVKNKNFATVLTTYGCPYKCSFCVMSTLGYRYREASDIVKELEHLKTIGKKEIFFIDQTFGVNKKILSEVCRSLKSLGFGWVCYSRVDVLDRKSLFEMKEGGCHTIIFGVESGSKDILKKYNKGYTKRQILSTFEICREIGISTVATFIIGLPEETEQTANETLTFLKKINCDYASFNIAVPRQNTGLRENAIAEGLVASDMVKMDQTGSFIAMPSKSLSKEQIMLLKKKAVRSFYLRPGYLLRRLKNISSFYELKEQIYEGWKLLRGM